MLAEILAKFIYNICKVIVDKRKALDTLKNSLAVKKDAAPMQNRLVKSHEFQAGGQELAVVVR